MHHSARKGFGWALILVFLPRFSVAAADEAPRVQVDTSPLEAPAGDGQALHDDTPLLHNAAGESAWLRCLERLQVAGPETIACLENLRRNHPNSAAALRADGALAALQRQSLGSEEGGWQIPPGRLELSSTAGLYGIWSGIAIGVSASAHFRPEATLSILGTGALAIGLGTGLGFGGYALADRLDLGEGDSRWIASSLVWGTTLGIAAIPPLLQLNLREGAEFSVPLMTVVSGGLFGGGLALLSTRFHRFSSAEVSLINTGGWVGALLGLLTLPVLDVWSIREPIFGSLSYITAATMGLTTGYLFSQVLDLSWGETLLMDLGAVLGLVTGGTVIFALNSSGVLAGLPGEIAVPLTCAGLGLSAVSGLAITAFSIALSRSSDRPIWKLSELELRPTLGISQVVLDMDRKPVWILSGPSLVF